MDGTGQAHDRAHNRQLWSLVNERFTDADAAARWSELDISWGLFRIPDADLGLLGDLDGLRVAELGAGTAYFSAWLARAGARPVALDLSAAQLGSARRCQEQTGIHFPLVEADGAVLPLATGAFDLVVSEYGAAPWCDPARWLPEAARILRPGGRLVFLTNSVLAGLCVPADEGFAGEQLLRPQRDLYPITWPEGGTEHHPGHGDWIRLLVDAGFVVDALHELYPPHHAATHEWYDIVTADWARNWPAEDLWVATLPG
ncbi:MAG: putative Methyltransferase type 11 [Ilumatobacteraceae bacterium]|nr:putative Methyltransferase type 11 [Ilumatobacteraceae bacterium]